MSEQVELMQEKLVAAGHRLTAARKSIIETLVGSHGHITADDLAAKVRGVAPQVGRMTVYRTLDLLCELGVIRPIYQGTGAAHFILMAEGSHHHLICNRCHRVFEFDDCTAGDLLSALAKQFDFEVSSHLLELHGLCAECR